MITNLPQHGKLTKTKAFQLFEQEERYFMTGYQGSVDKATLKIGGGGAKSISTQN